MYVPCTGIKTIHSTKSSITGCGKFFIVNLIFENSLKLKFVEAAVILPQLEKVISARLWRTCCCFKTSLFKVNSAG